MRHTKLLQISDEGRDKGKTFVLHEMPADQGDIWATQALCLLEEAGIVIPEEAKENGMAGLASVGLDSGARQLRALQHPSLISMWEYVKYQPPDSRLPQQPIFDGANSQIEEIRTRTQIRAAFLKLHTDFFSPGEGHKSADSTAPQASPATPT